MEEVVVVKNSLRGRGLVGESAAWDQILDIRGKGEGLAFLRRQGEIQFATTHVKTLAHADLMVAPETAESLD